MACTYFGPLEVNDPNTATIVAGWIASCSAEEKFPRGVLVGKIWQLYCCGSPTENPPATISEGDPSEDVDLRIELAGETLLRLVEGAVLKLDDGHGSISLVHRIPEQPSK